VNSGMGSRAYSCGQIFTGKASRVRWNRDTRNGEVGGQHSNAVVLPHNPPSRARKRTNKSGPTVPPAWKPIKFPVF